MQPTAVLDVVGLSPAHLGPDTPFLTRWASERGVSPIRSVLPAVTTTAQTTYLTGCWPDEHGIVANGWYFRDTCEVRLWQQSNKLVQKPSVWDMAKARDASFTVANMFWWYAMCASTDICVTPRPQYHSDGLKIPDFYTAPAGLRDELRRELGNFPLFNFWGPNTSIASSQWIADAAIRIHRSSQPTLSLVYLPHLDYNLQRHGESHETVRQDLREIDAVCEQLIRYYEGEGVEVMVLSEYGITRVDRPVHINRALRQAGLLQVREESGWELLDPGASAAFAVVDHQIAHVYINDLSKTVQVRSILEALPRPESLNSWRNSCPPGLKGACRLRRWAIALTTRIRSGHSSRPPSRLPSWRTRCGGWRRRAVTGFTSILSPSPMA